MAISKDSGRQYALVAEVPFTLAQIAAGANPALDLPAGAQITGGHLVIDTAFNSVTTDTIAVGDASTANRYLTATSVQALGRTALVPTGFKTTNTQPEILLTYAQTGAVASTGAGRLVVEYIIAARANENQG